jgi:hypothetical protein
MILVKDFGSDDPLRRQLNHGGHKDAWRIHEALTFINNQTISLLQQALLYLTGYILHLAPPLPVLIPD